MIPTLALLAGVLVTYALRLSFITIVPADRLPVRVRGALDNVGPAAMAAIVATHLAHGAPTGLWSPSLVAAAVAAAIAWRTGNLAFTVLGGIGAAAVLQVL